MDLFRTKDINALKVELGKNRLKRSEASLLLLKFDDGLLHAHNGCLGSAETRKGDHHHGRV